MVGTMTKLYVWQFDRFGCTFEIHMAHATLRLTPLPPSCRVDSNIYGARDTTRFRRDTSIDIEYRYHHTITKDISIYSTVIREL
jgi:hypothetical protein